MWCGCPLWVCVSTSTESVGLLGLACSARCVCVLGTTHSLAPSACFTPFWEIGSTVYCHASPPEPITADALPACLPLWPSNHTVTCTPLSLAWNCRDAVRGHAGIAALCLVSHSSRSPGASAGQRAIHARLHPGCAVKSRSQFGSVGKTACTLHTWHFHVCGRYVVWPRITSQRNRKYPKPPIHKQRALPKSNHNAHATRIPDLGDEQGRQQGSPRETKQKKEKIPPVIPSTSITK